MGEKDSSDWSRWLKTDTRYAGLLGEVVGYVSSISDRDVSSPDYFTRHDKTHCQAVEKMVKALINKSSAQLTDLETFILFLAVWTHDIGMTQSVAQEYFRERSGDYSAEAMREVHDEISAWFLSGDDGFRQLFDRKQIAGDLFDAYVHTINIVNSYHRRKNSLETCPEIRYVRGDEVRAKLLASLVRLADTLHCDSSRYDRKLYNLLQIGNFDRTARLHWLKSHVVSAVHLDSKRQTIDVIIDLPEPDAESRVELEENAKKLQMIVYDDIYEDVVAVSGTFEQYGLLVYRGVNVQVSYYPGARKGDRDEICGILNDLGILLSPNTSKVIEKSLESISSLAGMDFQGGRNDLFLQYGTQLCRQLKAIHEDRSCHVGLGKIARYLDEELARLSSEPASAGPKRVEEAKGRLAAYVGEIKATRMASQKEINRRADRVLGRMTHVILFGYSDMVSSFLEAVALPGFRQRVNIYVLECSGKRQLSTANRLEYDDGLFYAERLSASGFKNIALLPDTSLASLLWDESKQITSKDAVVLFGANGVDPDGSCGHTSGHRVVAMVAKHGFHIPVYVIADKFKKGKIKWRLDATRKGGMWLTGDRGTIGEIRKKEIQLVNYREDQITKDLITKIIMA